MKEQKEAFHLKVLSCCSKYTLLRQLHSANAEDGPMVDDEYIIEVECEVVNLPKRHRKKHVGKVIEFSLLGSERYDKNHKAEQEFFGSFNLRGAEGGGFVYMPTARLPIVEQNLRREVFKYIEVTSTPLRYGDGHVTMVHFSECLPIE